MTCAKSIQSHSVLWGGGGAGAGGGGRCGTVTAFQAEGMKAKAQGDALHLRLCCGARHGKLGRWERRGVQGQGRMTQTARMQEDWPGLCLPGGSAGKEPACGADPSSIPGSGRSPGEGNGNPLQYSCLENLMDRGAWWAAVQGVAKSWAHLSDYFWGLAWPRRGGLWAHLFSSMCFHVVIVFSYK